MIQRVSAVIFIFVFYAPVYAMEVAKELPEQDPSCNPAINTDGICHLARLPNDILNLIADYLVFPSEETDANFTRHVQSERKYIESCIKKINYAYRHNRDIKVDEHNVFGIVNGSLVHFQEHLSKCIIPIDSRKSFFAKMKARIKDVFTGRFDAEKITEIRSSRNGRFIVAFRKLISDEALYERLSQLCVYDHKEKKVEKVPVKKLEIPKESYAEKKELAIDKLKSGYTIQAHCLSKPVVVLGNPYLTLSISNNGNYIVFANQVQVFLLKKNNTMWGAVSCIRDYNDQIPEDRYDMHLPERIEWVGFNKQETKLGIVYKNKKNKLKTQAIAIEQDKPKRLQRYFLESGVCKDFKSVA